MRGLLRSALLNYHLHFSTFCQRALFVSVMLLCFSGSEAAATPTIVIGYFYIVNNSPAVSIPIFITGGDPLTGMNLVLEISQSGVFQGGGQPSITSIDMSTGTIWAGNQDAQNVKFSTANTPTHILNSPGLGGPAIWTPMNSPAVKVSDNFLVLSGTVPASGLLATITVSGVGAPPGVYDLKVTSFMVTNNNGATTSFTGYTGDQVSLKNGVLVEILAPEPSALALAAFGFIGFVAWGWRRKRDWLFLKS